MTAALDVSSTCNFIRLCQVFCKHMKRSKCFSVLQNPFQTENELDGLSKALVDIQTPILYAGAAVFLLAAAFLGSLVGSKAPGEP